MIKTMLMAIALVGFALGASSVYAGDACCASKKNSNISTKADACGDVFSKLNLTDEQKVKVAALKKECDATECTISSRQKMIEGMKGILTAEQLEKCKAECAKNAKGDKSGCPLMSADEKSDKKS